MQRRDKEIAQGTGQLRELLIQNAQSIGGRYPLCYRIGFLSYTSGSFLALLDVNSSTGQRTFSAVKAVEHSWADYIYSPPTRYGGNQPCVI